MSRTTCPERGDVIWLDFDPQVGQKQAGRRPALVLSHREYNVRTGLAIVCPMTTRVEKPWPFYVTVGDNSAIIADQVKCLDWRGRRAEVKERVSPAVMEKVIGMLNRIIMPPDTN
jgi:mRNA interferase MazF